MKSAVIYCAGVTLLFVLFDRAAGGFKRTEEPSKTYHTFDNRSSVLNALLQMELA
jgi:hypothetical protein